MSFWRDRRVVATGGSGFLGSCVVEKLREGGCPPVNLYGPGDKAAGGRGHVRDLRPS